MIYPSLSNFLAIGAKTLGPGPYALVLCEDLSEVNSTLRHALTRGFGEVLAFGPAELVLEDDLAQTVHHIHHDMTADGAVERIVNAMIDVRPGEWMHYCFNAEYLFYPFCESRSVRELAIFNTEERRNTVMTYVVDLYASDLTQHPDAVDLRDAHLDTSGYYALARKDPKDWSPRDRQLDFYGGLRWRYEEHIPYLRRRIDRVGLFRAAPGVHLRADHTFTDEEYNTYQCAFHHNVTAAICSFRTAKALKSNPASTFAIDDFRWRNSAQFNWSSQQLMELGLMEPGQWF